MNNVKIFPQVDELQQQVQTTLMPPPSSSLVNPFSGKAQEKAKMAYGDPMQRQQSLANPPLFKLDPMYNGKPGVQKEDFEQF
jgi:hypothetical protein